MWQKRHNKTYETFTINLRPGGHFSVGVQKTVGHFHFANNFRADEGEGVTES